MIKDQNIATPLFAPIETKNLRKCAFYWWHLFKDDYSSRHPEPNTASEYCDRINNYFNKIGAPEAVKKLIKGMENAASQQMLSQDDLKWINKENVRQCYWAWCVTRLADSEKSTNLQYDGKPVVIPNINVGATHLYSTLLLNSSPQTSRQRHDLIIKFLDLVPTNLDNKKAFVRCLKDSWLGVYATERFSWLDKKNKNQCTWAWEYITNSKTSSIPHWFIPSPSGNEMEHESTIATFDIWQAPTDTKKLFMIKMKKAWSQKKHRDKNKNKKPYSIVMSKDIKQKLDKIAKYNKAPKNEVVERLINAESEANSKKSSLLNNSNNISIGI